MKMTTLLVCTAGLCVVSAPAYANDFSGPRVEITAGYNDVSKDTIRNPNIAYGTELGYDAGIGSKVTAGVYAGVDNVFDRVNFNVGGRVGYTINTHTLLYVKGGYDNYRNVFSKKLEGFRLGGGLETNIAGPVYGKLEYRHTFLGKTNKDAAVAGVGIRF